MAGHQLIFSAKRYGIGQTAVAIVGQRTGWIISWRVLQLYIIISLQASGIGQVL